MILKSAWLAVPIFVGNGHNLQLQSSKLATALHWAGFHWVQLLFCSIIAQKDFQLFLSAADIESCPHPQSWSSLQLKLDQCPHPQWPFEILTWSHHCIVVGLHPNSACSLFVFSLWILSFFLWKSIPFFFRFMIFICMVLFTVLILYVIWTCIVAFMCWSFGCKQGR